MPIGSSQDADCRPERSAPDGAERDIPKIAGVRFTGVGTACQRPGAKRSRRRPAFFAGRSLTGRARARTLFPLWNGSVPVAAKSTADALPVRFCEVFLGQLARLPPAVHSYHITAHWADPIAKFARSLPREWPFGPQSTTGQTPDKARTHTGRQHTRRQRPRFRICSQPSTDQHVYAQNALQHPAGTH